MDDGASNESLGNELKNELEIQFGLISLYMKKGRYDQIWSLLSLLIKQEVKLKTKIQKLFIPSLNPEEEDSHYSDTEVNDIIETFGFYSNLRLRMIESISSQIINLYENNWIMADKMLSFFINELQNEFGSISDTYAQQQIFDEIYNILIETKSIGDRIISVEKLKMMDNTEQNLLQKDDVLDFVPEIVEKNINSSNAQNSKLINREQNSKNNYLITNGLLMIIIILLLYHLFPVI